MLAWWRRVAPFVLTGVLLFDIAIAIVHGSRENWIRVAVTALALALALWWQARTRR